jgi:hypothetical protein
MIGWPGGRSKGHTSALRSRCGTSGGVVLPTLQSEADGGGSGGFGRKPEELQSQSVHDRLTTPTSLLSLPGGSSEASAKQRRLGAVCDVPHASVLSSA